MTEQQIKDHLKSKIEELTDENEDIDHDTYYEYLAAVTEDSIDFDIGINDALSAISQLVDFIEKHTDYVVVEDPSWEGSTNTSLLIIKKDKIDGLVEGNWSF